MISKKKEHPKEKPGLHPRNKHKERYNFKLLIDSCPELAPYVLVNKYDDESVDFFNPDAVKMLNAALLKHYYDIAYWNIPSGYLCPPIPGRADYIHHIADLLGSNNKGKIPTGAKVKCLDIGVGANCVYPIIGIKEYGWSFVGTDIDPVSIESATKIVERNSVLKGCMELRLQNNFNHIFSGIIQKDEFFDLTICNPPFHSSFAEAQSGSRQKINNLKHKNTSKPILNFGGKNNELWCQGGEERFVRDMIHESKRFFLSCFWFSTLISRQSNLSSVYEELENAGAIEVRTIPMGQGNKISRIVAWTFLSRNNRINGLLPGGRSIAFNLTNNIIIINNYTMAKILNIEGLSAAEINNELSNGAKFVVFPYCISIIVMTFKRSSDIYFIKSSDSALKHGYGFILLSFFFGWWGIPWGPIYTIGSLYSNLTGGKDVSAAVLNSIHSK